jgi:hypothetical protein
VSGQREATEGLRRLIALTRGSVPPARRASAAESNALALAAAVERVLDLCDERMAAVSGVVAKYGEPGDEWQAAVTVASLRAALLGESET